MAGTTFPARSLTTFGFGRVRTVTVAPATGGEASVSVIAGLPGEQVTLWTATGAPLISAEKSDGLTVLHASGSLNVAVTAVLPGAAVIDTNVGGVLSTLTERVIVGEDLPAVSIARNEMVCGPSASGGGLNVQVAAGVPHAEQLTPAVENGPASTLASIRAMAATADRAVPE